MGAKFKSVTGKNDLFRKYIPSIPIQLHTCPRNDNKIKIGTGYVSENERKKDGKKKKKKKKKRERERTHGRKMP